MVQGRTSFKYRVKLTTDERDELEQLIRHGRVAGWKVQRAQAILKFDESDVRVSWPNSKIAEAFELSTRTVEKWRKQAVERGPLSLLERKVPDRSMFRKLDGVGEAKLIQLACSTPPAGRSRWTLRMLADELVALEVVDSIRYECVRQTLQKTK